MISEKLINEIIRLLKEEGVLSTKNLADRYYTVSELYDHRLVLFKIICHTYSHLAWKTKKHFDGEIFNDTFLVGIDTPLGPATYHFKIKFFEDFDIKEIDHGPKYDGYTPDDVLKRIQSLPHIQKDYIKANSKHQKNDSDIIKNEIKGLDELAEILNAFVLKLKELELIKTTQLSDGHHTLEELYRQKRELFKFVCHNYSDLAWKSKFDLNNFSIDKFSKKTFLAGINTPQGPACYVLNDLYYDEFKVKELPNAPVSVNEIYTNVLGKLSSVEIRKNRTAKQKELQ